MRFIDGTKSTLGRLASYVAKQALKGEEFKIFNCRDVIITGNKKSIAKEFSEMRSRFGHSQKGPKHHATSEKIVKRTIRGMLPDFRKGRGKIAFKKIMCYNDVPNEFKDVKMETIFNEKKIKSAEVHNFTKSK